LIGEPYSTILQGIETPTPEEVSPKLVDKDGKLSSLIDPVAQELASFNYIVNSLIKVHKAKVPVVVRSMESALANIPDSTERKKEFLSCLERFRSASKVNNNIVAIILSK